MTKKIHYPEGADFAFTILDDTDDTTVLNGRPVYDFLAGLGLRTTKTVWAFDTPIENQGPYFAGETLASPQNLEWVHELNAQGFEIAFHNATMGSSLRDDTIRALAFVEREFGKAVRLHCNHGQNKENLHWGADRYHSFIIRSLFNLQSRFRSYPVFEGSTLGSDYFWSDVADEQIDYIRAFTFRALNGAKVSPGGPFLDNHKQKKSLFFNTTDAPDVSAFNQLVNRASIDKLRSENGFAIVSTHLGKGFYRDGQLNTEFRQTMEYLASLPGYFVPVSELLDFTVEHRGVCELSWLRRRRMECLHILDRVIGRL